MTNEARSNGAAERPERPGNVDYVQLILNDFGGSFKRFQIISFSLFCIPFILSGSFGLSYVFTSLNLNYRCEIPQCEVANHTIYDPHWLPNAVPYSNGKPAKCSRYEFIGSSSSPSQYCSSDQFNRSNVQRCGSDGFVFKTDEISIQNEFGLFCEENNWKLAMVGTTSNMGRFAFMPALGMLSDRYGRRFVLVVGVLGSCSFAMLRSFATNYSTFLLLEFLEAGIGAVSYSASFLLAMEWIGVKDRVLLGTVMTATYPFGQIFLGIVARQTHNFRTLLRIIFAPGFVMVLYVWIAPESIRWLIVKGKRERTLRTLKRASRVNGVSLSPNTVSLLEEKFLEHGDSSANNAASSGTKRENQLSEMFRNKTLLIRFVVCACVWMTNAFVSYGISLTSISLEGDIYINFIVIAIAGIPAMLILYILMETCGRRWTQCSSLIITGVCIIGSKLLPPDFSIMSIALFFIGKCFITVSFSGLYVYTSELWPTNLRHSIMSLCSTVGRIGAMFAPLAPLLSQYFELLPYMVFGAVALAAGIIALQLPETLNKDLPDTLDEAVRIQHPTETSETS